jgi:tetratricopeptide (TPR) repeat protein
MYSEDFTAEALLACGIDAYRKQQFEQATEHFDRAVALAPSSVQSYLSAGVARFTLAKRGYFSPSPAVPLKDDEYREDEWAAHAKEEKRMRAEQNSTNWPLAERSLKRANELDPQNRSVVEYLSALYFLWKDPDEQIDRLDEAKHWLERLAELDPQNDYANFYCGVILTTKAQKLLPNYGPVPSTPEPDLASRRISVEPLLDEASRHLERAATLVKDQSGIRHFSEQIASMKLYLSDPDQAARDLREKHTQLFRKHVQASETGASARSSAKVTFRLTPEALAEDREKRFPPNPWRIPLT